MGMYTELHFNSKLRKDIPDKIINALKYMIIENTGECPHFDHPLFETDRWHFMLLSDSRYFDADTHSTLRFDEISNTYRLCIRCNLKNYDQEIEKFLNWITPYLNKAPGKLLGFMRHETWNEPTLIYYGEIAERLEVETICLK